MSQNPYTGDHTHNWTNYDGYIQPYIAPPPAIYTFPNSNWYWRKEDEMSTLDKVARERKEEAERKRIEAAYDLFDSLELDEVDEGTVIRFDVIEASGNVYTYAVLYAGERWWATGGTSPNGVGLEDLLAWMIRKNVDPAKVVTL